MTAQALSHERHNAIQGEAAEAAGRWDEAETQFSDAVIVDPSAKLINTALWLGLCRARLHLRKAREATQACDTAAELAPDDAETSVLQVSCP